MNEKIIDKIRKLLRLAESADVHEAATAAGAAQRLMEAHQIDQAMIGLDDEDESPVEDEPIRQFDDEDSLHVWSRLADWKLQLAHVIASENACRTFQSRTWVKDKRRSMRNIGLIGRPSQVATVRYLFSYLLAEIDRLCRKEARGKGRTWANNFRLGAVYEVAKRLKEARLRAREDARSRYAGDAEALVRLDAALVRLDAMRDAVDAWIKANLKLYASSRSRRRADWKAWHEGRKAARDIDLDTGGSASLGTGPRALRASEAD